MLQRSINSFEWFNACLKDDIDNTSKGFMRGLARFTKANITAWKAKNGINMLRLSLGIVFLWFGFLKFFTGISPAEDIAGRTISTLTFGLIKPAISMPLLAVWECTIGLGLITKAWMRLTLILLYFQMAGTFLPILFFPHETFSGFFTPTLLGQYIIKNFVLISGGIVLGAAVQESPPAVKVNKNEAIKLMSTRAIAETFEEDFAAHKN